MTAKILLVDDDPMSRAILRRLLEKRGHRVNQAACVADAKASLAAGTYDMVVSDVELPDGRGHDVLAALRERAGQERTPVIACTAHGSPGDRLALLQAGFSDCVEKPVQASSFVLRVEAFLAAAARDEVGPRTLLVLDDDPQFRAVAGRVLEQRGHQVRHAASGAEADLLLAQQTVDLVVVDGVLPDTLGFEWIERFRAGGGAARLVFVSAYWKDFEAYLDRLIDPLGVALVLQKPILPSVFADLIEGQLVGVPAQAAEPEAEAAAPDSLSDLVAGYEAYLPEAIRALTECVQGLRADAADATSLERARILAHNLRGTAGSYGYPEVGEAAGRIERAVMAAAAGGAGAVQMAWPEVTEALEAATAYARRRPPAARAVASGVTATVLYVDMDDAARQDAAAFGRGRHVRVLPSRGGADALALARTHKPDAVFVSLDPDDAAAAPRWVAALRGQDGGESLPVAFVSARDELEDRVAAAHAGAALFLVKPLSESSFGDAMHKLLAVHEHESPRVLVVDDDPGFARLVGAILREGGMVPLFVEDVRAALPALRREAPDAVLLDVIMPHVSGLDLCRVLRADPELSELPILVVTAEWDAATRAAAYRSGADDYVLKPVVAEEISGKLRVQIERVRSRRAREERDSLTGLLLPAAFLRRAQRRIEEARGRSERFALALLDVDRLREVNERSGPRTGDEILAAVGKLMARRFRTEDLRGRWCGDEFVLGLVGNDPAAAEGAVAKLLAEVAALSFRTLAGDAARATMSAGLAVFPKDGVFLDALLGAAERRLRAAKETGNRVVAGH